MLAGRGYKLHISPLPIALISDDVALVCEQVQHAEFAVSYFKKAKTNLTRHLVVSSTEI